MERAGIQILILTIFTAVAIPEYFFLNKNSSTGTGDFILVKKVCGIELYERWNTLAPDLLAREVKATFTVRADMNAAASLIKDEKKGMQWNKATSVYQVLEEGEDYWICYIVYDLPWPVSNQECVLQYTQSQSSDTLTLNFKGVDHTLFPIQNGTHRIHDIRGKWMFTKINDSIKVEYFITTTPSKTLPRWVTDPIIRNNLIETMRAFRSLLEEDVD